MVTAMVSRGPPKGPRVINCEFFLLAVPLFQELDGSVVLALVQT